MTTKHKDKKIKKFTDDEIRQYCQSVEQLLTKISERAVISKRKKAIIDLKEEVVTEDEESFVLS